MAWIEVAKNNVISLEVIDEMSVELDQYSKLICIHGFGRVGMKDLATIEYAENEDNEGEYFPVIDGAEFEHGYTVQEIYDAMCKVMRVIGRYAYREGDITQERVNDMILRALGVQMLWTEDTDLDAEGSTTKNAVHPFYAISTDEIVLRRDSDG